ncbi:tripartite tricarboxylate transporter TctB family protein [Neomicrococcus aestuarii]|uniref:DUF1468 domain-containing protein n=1 Tax=Neomicrococcus aestuarii TaxID=556325 RepID=A0A1L2ZMY0_9MICC|nr:tripartite tricarboxylate transporter TctB family protein [Neomicrococcus aestuarii]APF40388.1 hypothetical protein BHE16_04430 [Neomicrococcus aestuarii]
MTNATTSLKGRSELGVAAFLFVVGAVVLWNGATMTAPFSHTDPVGPRAFPFIIGGLLVVVAVLLAIDVWRGGHGEAEDGEDVDLASGTDWKTLLPLVGAFVLNILLIDTLGWVISGSILFFSSVWALGGRSYIRMAIISIVLALVSFYGFYLGLGIKLPAGLLGGIL